MTAFTEKRRDLIQRMKSTIKSRSHDTGGLSHDHFVLYSALRGKDVRLTSHQPDGQNALDILSNLKRSAKKDGLSIWVRKLFMDHKGAPPASEDDLPLIYEACQEAASTVSEEPGMTN